MLMLVTIDVPHYSSGIGAFLVNPAKSGSVKIVGRIFGFLRRICWFLAQLKVMEQILAYRHLSDMTV